ncbi:MAG: hypothetical protein R8M45_00245 [Ghiorsea sp.]
MAEVTTSLVITLGTAGATGILTAEIDARPDGMNKGVTSFVPTDTVYFLVFSTSNVNWNPITMLASYGSPTAVGSGSMTVTETLTFAGTNTATASKPVSGGFSSVWLGNSLGAVTVIDEVTIRSATVGVAAAQITYTSNFDIYYIVSPATLAGLKNFPIVVTISGNATDVPLV